MLVLLETMKEEREGSIRNLVRLTPRVLFVGGHRRQRIGPLCVRLSRYHAVMPEPLATSTLLASHLWRHDMLHTAIYLMFTMSQPCVPPRAFPQAMYPSHAYSRPLVAEGRRTRRYSRGLSSRVGQDQPFLAGRSSPARLESFAISHTAPDGWAQPGYGAVREGVGRMES